MKTRLLLTIAILAFNLNLGFTENVPEVSVNMPLSNTQVNLAPVAPLSADFSDFAPESAPSTLSLMPVTPKEATFDEDIQDGSMDTLLKSLSPSVPTEADFCDDVTSFNSLHSLNPITPSEAGFEETV